VLQGTISAKNAANQFTVDIGGQQVLAESTAQLQIGQKLHLQVATLTPQVELQIVGLNTVDQKIGNAIHLIGEQSATLPSLTVLAEKSGSLPQLSSSSKETLQFYANSIAPRPGGGAVSLVQPQLAVQLLSKMIEALKAPQSPNSEPIYGEISSLLRQLPQTSSLSQETAIRAMDLANVFSQLATALSSAGISVQTGLDATTMLPIADTANLLGQIAKLYQDNSQIQDLLSRLIPMLQENAALPASHPLLQLVTFLTQLKSETIESQPFQLDGKQLQKITDRLGIDMEQLLADGNRDKAVQTLKFALLELSQQLPGGDKGTPQAVQITKSIELYQLLQIRLANESLSFIPLPFPFLNQGYLLIDDRSQRESPEKSGQSEKTAQLFELHLQLEGLGNLQIDIRQKDGGVTLKFLAEDSERAKFLASFRDELNHWLTMASLESAHFLVGAKEPTKSLLEKIVSGATGMVDTNA
jgi:hypothetical protein